MKPAVLAGAVAVHVAAFAVILQVGGGHQNLLLLTVTSATFLVAVAVLARAKPSRRVTAWLVLGVGAVLQLAALTRTPQTSDDANRYVWDGIVQFAGVDPYRYAPQDQHLQGDRTTFLFGPESACTHPIPGGCTSINRPTAHTIYPPVAQLAFDAGYVLSFGGHGGVLVFQLFGAVGALAIAALLLQHALSRDRPLWPVALWAWCPVIASEFGNNAHLDWLGVLLALLALRAGGAGRDTRAGVLTGLAIATKLYPALVLPALLRRRPWWITGVAAATVVVVYVPHLVVAASDVLGYLPGYLRENGYDSGNRFVLLGLVLPTSVATAAAVVLLVAAAWWTSRRSDPGAPEHAATLLIGLAFAVATPAYGWYGTLLLAVSVMSARYEWIALGIAPSFVYLIRADTHSDSYAPWVYLAGAVTTVVVWWLRTRRSDEHRDGPVALLPRSAAHR